MSKDALPAGTHIATYVIGCVLGQNALSITYYATDTKTNDTVLIRESFPSGMAARGDDFRVVADAKQQETFAWSVRKFEDDWAPFRRFKHSNILKVREQLSCNGTSYVVIDHLTGATFERWLETRPRRPDLETLRPIIDPVMQGVAYLHGEGLIHRGLSPSSFLITSDGRPVLIDFSAMCPESGDVPVGKPPIHVWTRHYSAPELSLRDARPTRSADSYGLGAILYRALAGQPPADGQDRLIAFALENRELLVPLASFGETGCSPAAEQAIGAALAVRPVDRPASVAKLREMLGWT